MKKIFYSVFLILIFWGTAVFAADFYRSDPSTTITINEHGVCWKVTNNGPNSYFIPTRTAVEWSTFIVYKPADISLGPCGYTHISGYGHTWTSLSPQRSRQAAIEACQHFYSDNPCQCGVYSGAAGVGSYYATYASNCHKGAPGFSGHTCCSRAWEVQKKAAGNMYIWIYGASGWCGWYVGATGNSYNWCAQPLVNWY